MSVRISSAAGMERIRFTPWPAHRERYPASPLLAAAVRMALVRLFCVGNGKMIEFSDFRATGVKMRG
jgi:hypothetical protein